MIRREQMETRRESFYGWCDEDDPARGLSNETGGHDNCAGQRSYGTVGTC